MHLEVKLNVIRRRIKYDLNVQTAKAKIMMNRTVEQKFIQSKEKALKNTKRNHLKASGKLLLQMYPVTRKRLLRLLTGKLMMLQLWADKQV